jgi:hypothetical protein
MNPLGVHMKIRDFPVIDYWTSLLNNMIDILHIEYMPHDEGHKRARDFFLQHNEYTHFVFLPDDVVITPSHLALLLEDAKLFDENTVVCGYCNVGFKNSLSNVNQKDMRNLSPMFYEQYEFLDILDIIQGKYGFPFFDVFFQGNALSLIPRKVVERLSLKPYKYLMDSLFGKSILRGIMHDLQMSNELKSLGIRVVCDARLIIMHFGATVHLVNIKNKRPRIYLKRRSGEVIKIFEASFTW